MNSEAAPDARLFTFIGGASGAWRVQSASCIVGTAIAIPSRLSVLAKSIAKPHEALWALRGITSNLRYVIRDEREALLSKQEGLGRPACTQAALIPIRKNAAWWSLTQDARRSIFEAQSHHIAIGLKYLPAIARRLHHCRDLGSDEPFDFLTWFEYSAADTDAFEELLAALRASPEWHYVDREVDIRLVKDLT
jgi:Chlorite dismutase